MSMEPWPVVVVVADRPVGSPVLSRTCTVILPSALPWFQVTVPQPVGEPGKSAKAMSCVVTSPAVASFRVAHPYPQVIESQCGPLAAASADCGLDAHTEVAV